MTNVSPDQIEEMRRDALEQALYHIFTNGMLYPIPTAVELFGPIEVEQYLQKNGMEYAQEDVEIE